MLRFQRNDRVLLVMVVGVDGVISPARSCIEKYVGQD